VVLEAGLTVMLWVRAPVLHEKVVPPEAVRVALSPAHKVAGEIEAVRLGVTVTVVEVVAVHPPVTVTVTV